VSFLFFYDPNLIGHLEQIENEIERMIVNTIIAGDLYYILLVISRVKTMSLDKQLRLKVSVLQDISPQDFGVKEYLLLNDKTPILKIAKSADISLSKRRKLNNVEQEIAHVFEDEEVKSEIIDELDFQSQLNHNSGTDVGE